LKIKRVQLSILLNGVGAAIKDKSPLPILTHCKLRTFGDLLEAEASSLDLFMQSRVECEGKLEPVCVKHAALLPIVAASTCEEVELELAKDKLIVKAGKSVFRLNTLDAAEFPPMPSHAVNFNVPQKSLSEALRATAWSVISSKANRPELENVILKLGDGLCRAFAGNGYSLAAYKEECQCQDLVLAVPGAHAVKLANALLCTGATFWVSENYCGVTTGFTHMAVKLTEQKIPAFDQVIKAMEKPAPNAMLKLEDLKAIASKTKLLSDNVAEIPIVKLTISKGKVEIEGAGNIGDFTDSFEWSGDHEASFRLNAGYLTATLKHLIGETVSVHATEFISVWSDGLRTIGLARIKD